MSTYENLPRLTPVGFELAPGYEALLSCVRLETEWAYELILTDGSGEYCIPMKGITERDMGSLLSLSNHHSVPIEFVFGEKQHLLADYVAGLIANAAGASLYFRPEKEEDAFYLAFGGQYFLRAGISREAARDYVRGKDL